MQLIIRYIKDCEFIATASFIGSVDEAFAEASRGVAEHHADLAAVLDQDNMDAEPKLLVRSGH
jgi:hypothetical protein